MRKTSILAFVLLTAASATWAQSQTCEAKAAEKKLAGAAKNSFLQKCEKDAASACDISAADKKLAGAAKSSFVKKCTKDAVGG